MTDAFSFSIELTQPPADAPAEIVASVALYDGMSEPVYTGRLLADPFKPSEGELLRWYLEKYWAWPYEQFAERAQLIERLLPELGQRLYRAAFDDVEPGAIAQLNIVTSVPAAMNLPWELLHDGSGFLALRDERPVSIARRLALQRDESSSAKFTPPLRILLVTARPEYVDFIDSRSVARELLDEAQGQIEAGMMELEFLRPPTFEALKNRLGQAPPVHVLHFDGHGEFKSKRGSVLFENDHGGPDQVRAEDLARALQACGVHLAVLNACQSASGDLNSVAAKLAGSGVAAVVAMGASVLVVSATRYVEAFYRELAAGAPVTLAHEVARRALHDDPRRHLNRRRIDEQGLPVELHDWWLPQLYQQRPLSLQIEDPADRTPCSVRRGDDRDAELRDRAWRRSRGGSATGADRTASPRPEWRGRRMFTLQSRSGD